MKYIYLILVIFLLLSCSKPKTVLICGDHICINKDEAEQYFEENLSLEVKVIHKKRENEINLVELNLKEYPSGKKKITLLNKENTSDELKILTNDEKIKIKKSLSNKKKSKKLAKKDINENKDEENFKKSKMKKNEKLRKQKSLNNINQKKNSKKETEVVDVCTILEKCSIDEISKFLLEQGKKKNFPDITIRQ